jgi:hypothetical protein
MESNIVSEEEYNPHREYSNGWKGYVPYQFYVGYCEWCEQVFNEVFKDEENGNI